MTRLILHALLLATLTSPASAVGLDFSALCADTENINVTGADTGIAFRKNPGTQTTRQSTATIRKGAAMPFTNILVNVGQSTCFFATAGNDTYCFQARGTNQIVNINAVPGNNHLGAPACN